MEGKDADKPLASEGFELMAAAFEVHNVQGGGLLEEIYRRVWKSSCSFAAASVARSRSCMSTTRGNSWTKSTFQI